ncbi:MAG: carboxypeptidase-like regulatory domain-containing protein [Oceanicaulis sp.]|nr:carboxypeptidase-like regulatory domain-containing protein [Oceanicaulis sp.]
MMTIRSGLAALLAAPLLTACLSQHEYAEAPDSAGLVITLDGAPVAGAQVSYPGLEDAETVQADAEGRFQLAARMGERRRMVGPGGVFADSALVRARAPGLSDGWASATFINGLDRPEAENEVLVVMLEADAPGPGLTALAQDCLQRPEQRHALALAEWAGGLDREAAPDWLTPERARWLDEHLRMTLSSGAVSACGESSQLYQNIRESTGPLIDIGRDG